MTQMNYSKYMRKLQNKKNIAIYFQDEGSGNYLLSAIHNFVFNQDVKLFILLNHNVKHLSKKIFKPALAR